jgi:hypothetical protein
MTIPPSWRFCSRFPSLVSGDFWPGTADSKVQMSSAADEHFSSIGGTGGRRGSQEVEIIAAVLAFAAAIFWFLSAYGEVPPMQSLLGHSPAY